MLAFPNAPGVLYAFVFALLAAAPASADDAARLHAAVAVERARVPALRFQRSDFLVRPAIEAVTLSPDGRRVAWLREHGRHREVWLQPTMDGRAHRLLADTAARQLHWTRDGRWLLLESPRQLFALATAGQAGSSLVTALGDRVRRELQTVDATHPAAIIALERSPAPRQGAPAHWRLLRVDMRGRRTVLHADTHRIAGFALHPDGRLAFLSRVEGEALVIHRVAAPGGLHEVLRCGSMHRCDLLPVTGDRGELLLHGDPGGSLSRLLRLDAQRAVHTLHADPHGDADLADLVLDPISRRPLIASYRSIEAASYGLTDDTSRRVAAIARQFPQRQLRIQVGVGADAHWLVNERGSSLQGERWHLHDPRTGRFRRLLDEPPLRQLDDRPGLWLPASALARKIPVVWRASDGMRLHGFLLLPPGADPARVPLVVNVHGGPWSHAQPEYGRFSQFIVNRGYAVFEPNFRGSTGYGRDYIFAAQGDYGNGRVHRDIVDGVRHLLAQGIGDAQRVGIVGASFGGYSTLLGLTFSPELFKVGVAMVPPPEFGWNLRWTARNAEALSLSRHVPLTTVLRMLSLDIADEATMARLHAQSPLANAARLRRPLLLIAGGEDRRVAISGVIEYAARLKLLDKDVSLLIDPQAAHSSDDPLYLEASLYLLESVLQAHLGGAAPAPPRNDLRRYLDRNLRMTGHDLHMHRPSAGEAKRNPRPDSP
ncbi:S9 family peptidase [Luteimonas suaedae]|uniref:S9 family peptidase n=1 Tax=Luteimonas suaedae TaxID=2605430 RepID=UPI0011EC2726|nr:prolyl oligopeptidase family serine peptidase [Luteimonas suaedae]